MHLRVGAAILRGKLRGVDPLLQLAHIAQEDQLCNIGAGHRTKEDPVATR